MPGGWNSSKKKNKWFFKVIFACLATVGLACQQCPNSSSNQSLSSFDKSSRRTASINYMMWHILPHIWLSAMGLRERQFLQNVGRSPQFSLGCLLILSYTHHPPPLWRTCPQMDLLPPIGPIALRGFAWDENLPWQCFHPLLKCFLFCEICSSTLQSICSVFARCNWMPMASGSLQGRVPQGHWYPAGWF